MAHLPLVAVLQSVAYLIFGLEQDVLQIGGAGPADGQLVIQVAHTAHVHVSGRVCGDCTGQEAGRRVGKQQTVSNTH